MLYTKVDGDSFNNTAADFQVFPECFSFRYSRFSLPPYDSSFCRSILTSGAFAAFISLASD